MRSAVHASRGTRRGGALLISLVASTFVAGLVAAVYTLSYSQTLEVNAFANQTRALYVADAGISESIVRVSGALALSNPVPAAVGSQAAPLAQRGGRYWCDLVEHASGRFTITSTGMVNLTRRSVEAVIEPLGGGIYDYAIFAGNRAQDPNYALELGGEGAQADVVEGNVYSGGNVAVTGDATVSGGIDASGAIAGSSGNEGTNRPLPNIVAMNYEANHDFDVNALFASATPQADALGGTAWQVPEDNPAHIFRRNPSDRATSTSGTPKDDYFLEDPYESLNGFTDPDGYDGQLISLSGVDGKPGPPGTNKVYFIDGNLWLHNKPLRSLQLYNPAPEGARVTFVVKGNIYFSDNLYIDDPSKSGIAFLAINDPSEPDSGNIYFGDPDFGTLQFMQAFMYAENNFYDNGLDEAGSASVVVAGNMTAGNHVDINRDYVDDAGNTQHSRLTVEFDDRLSTGALVLPGLPETEGGTAGFRIVSWRELAN
jgi:hypothetical protein